jgi:hypothetical protein
MASAVNVGGPKLEHRRAKPPSYDPMKTQAKLLADRMWEDAKKIANVLAPDSPTDQQELDPKDQWMVLELVASSVSPLYWDKPEAIRDLYRLRKMFVPNANSDYLKIVAQKVAKQTKSLPDPNITPESPEFDKARRRLEVTT